MPLNVNRKNVFMARKRNDTIESLMGWTCSKRIRSLWFQRAARFCNSALFDQYILIAKKETWTIIWQENHSLCHPTDWFNRITEDKNAYNKALSFRFELLVVTKMKSFPKCYLSFRLSFIFLRVLSAVSDALAIACSNDLPFFLTITSSPGIRHRSSTTLLMGSLELVIFVVTSIPIIRW